MTTFLIFRMTTCFFHQHFRSLTYNDDDCTLHDSTMTSLVSDHHGIRVRHSESREVNVTYHFTYVKSGPRFRYTLALNAAFLVAAIKSPRYGGPSVWQTTIDITIAM